MAVAVGVLCAPALALADADLAVTKVDTPDPVGAGQNITYTITVTNNGPDPAANVNLTDVVPASTTFVSFSAPVGWTSTTPAVGGTGTVTSSIPSLPLGSAVFTLVVNVNADTPPASTIGNTATVTSSTADPNTGNDAATASTTVSPFADLAVSKDDDSDPVSAGANLTYTITAANNGPSDADNVELSDTLPPGTTFVSFSGPAGWTLTTPAVGGTGTVTASNGTFASEDGAGFELVVKVDAGVAHGTVLNNTVDISSPTPDPASSNNSDTETTEVNEVADLSVAKSGSPSTVLAGSDVTYELTVGNSGPATGESVSLSDAVPAGTTFVSATQTAGPSFTLAKPAAGGTGTFTASRATLANGATAKFEMVVRVNGDRPDGSTISNTATVDGVTFDPDSADDSASTSTSVGNPPPPPAFTPAPLTPRPPRLTIGDPRMREGSGVVFVPLTCEFHPRDVCVTDVTVTFNTVFHKLDPITVRNVQIGGGQSLDLYMAATKAQRRKMKRIGTMPITVSATNSPEGDVVKQGLLHGQPRRER